MSTTNTSNVIVVFKAGTSQAEVDQSAKELESQGGKVGNRYEQSLIGFSASIPDHYLTTLAAHPHLDFIEADGPVSIAAKKMIKKRMSHSHSHCSGQHNDHSHDHDGPDRGDEFSLWRYIQVDQIRALNELTPGSAKSVFRPWDDRLIDDKFVESDMDEQLLIYVPFTGQVKLKSIALRSNPDESAPSQLKVFINTDSLDFDSAQSTDPTQQWDLVSPADILSASDSRDGVVQYTTRVAKFAAVKSLTLFVPMNFGADRTIIQYIGLSGDFKPLNKDPIITLYEAAANPTDHTPIAGINSLTSNRTGM